MKDCIAYVRVSTNGQIDGTGINRQIDNIKSYCQQNNYNLTETYIEKGVSGALYDRPELNNVLNHHIKTIIIEGLDRLGRDLLISEKIIFEMQSKGIELISTKEGTDLLDANPSRIMIRQIVSAVSQWDKSNIVQRLKSGRDRVKAQTGKCEGQKSYLEMKPNIVKEVKRLRRKPKGHKALSYSKIAQKMNDNGFTTAKDLPFTMTTVRSICRNY